MDYVKFIIKPNKHKTALVLWFGGMAFHPDPPGDILNASASVTQIKPLNVEGNETGLNP